MACRLPARSGDPPARSSTATTSCTCGPRRKLAMAEPLTNSPPSLVVIHREAGVTLIPTPTPLTALNYFDGKFLRASELQLEQRWVRMLVELSNQGGSPGVAHGFDATLAPGDALRIGPGLAFDPPGRVLFFPQEAFVSIQELIE